MEPADVRGAVVEHVYQRATDGNAGWLATVRAGPVGHPQAVRLNREQRQLVAARVHHQQPPAIVAEHDRTRRGQVRLTRPAPTRGIAPQRGERAVVRAGERDDLVVGGIVCLNINGRRHGLPADAWAHVQSPDGHTRYTAPGEIWSPRRLTGPRNPQAGGGPGHRAASLPSPWPRRRPGPSPGRSRAGQIVAGAYCYSGMLRRPTLPGSQSFGAKYPHPVPPRDRPRHHRRATRTTRPGSGEPQVAFIPGIRFRPVIAKDNALLPDSAGLVCDNERRWRTVRAASQRPRRCTPRRHIERPLTGRRLSAAERI